MLTSFFERLETTPGSIKIPSATLGVDHTDTIAFELIRDLTARYPNLTQGEIEDILTNALFWVVLWGASEQSPFKE